jgi:hypothetical protein
VTYDPSSYLPPESVLRSAEQLQRFLPPPDQLRRIFEDVRRYQDVYARAAGTAKWARPLVELLSSPAVAEVRKALDAAQAGSDMLRPCVPSALNDISPATQPVPTTSDLDETAEQLRSSLPESRDEAEELEQAVSEIATDPEKLSLVDRVADSIKRADVASLTPWGLLTIFNGGGYGLTAGAWCGMPEL